MVPVEASGREQQTQHDGTGLGIQLEFAAGVIACAWQQQAEDLEIFLGDVTGRVVQGGEGAVPGRGLAVAAGLEAPAGHRADYDVGAALGARAHLQDVQQTLRDVGRGIHDFRGREPFGALQPLVHVRRQRSRRGRGLLPRLRAASFADLAATGLLAVLPRSAVLVRLGVEGAPQHGGDVLAVGMHGAGTHAVDVHAVGALFQRDVHAIGFACGAAHRRLETIALAIVAESQDPAAVGIAAAPVDALLAQFLLEQVARQNQTGHEQRAMFPELSCNM